MSQAMIEGLRLSGANSVHEQYLDALVRGRKEPFTAELFARSVHEGATVIDGGAYLGFYALLAARRIGPEGTVIAFEPNPDTFEVLSRNVRGNGFEDRVITLLVGIDASSRRRPFYLGRGDESKSSLFVPRRWRAVTETECTSLDEALGALRGMRRTLAASPQASLIVECNPEALVRAGKSPRTLLRELDRAGFDVSAIDDERWELHPVDATTVAASGHVNLYCRRTR
jgi:FkbM family methyltransferase